MADALARLTHESSREGTLAGLAEKRRCGISAPMASAARWRRVSDWKQTVTVVDLADVEPAFLRAHGLVRPDDRLRARFPRLARLAATTRFARVAPSLAKLLHAAGVATYEVGYHRGSDGMLFADENR